MGGHQGVGKDRVQKLMQRHGIKARGKRKFIATTDSNHDMPVAENLLVGDNYLGRSTTTILAG